MNADLPTVFVVDDDPGVCKSLLRLLMSAGHRAESFTSAEDFLARWETDPVPGCVLVDLQMPGLDGLQLQERLQTATQGIPIIFITGHGDIPTSVKAMKAGAVDFLPKPLLDEDLLDAVQEAFQRDRRDRIAQAEHAVIHRRYATLTPREREVMALVVRGMLNKQIAYDLGVSEKTVKIHRGRVMQKMKVDSVADLVRATQKLTPDPDTP